MVPLTNLENRGNTCWASATVQALRPLRCFAKHCNTNSVFGKAVASGTLSDTLVPHLFKWTRNCLKNNEGKGHRPADCAEFLVELFDRKDVNSKCFQSNRVKKYECQTCHHIRRVKTEEKMLIINALPNGPSPLQKAVDAEFGYPCATPEITPYAPAVPVFPETPVLSPPRDAQPGSMSVYNNGFAGPAGAHGAMSAEQARDAEQSKRTETWYRCDDGRINEVYLDTATPYVLFYEERGGAVKLGESTAKTTSAGDGAPAQDGEGKFPIFSLDCDEGKCLGTKQPHTAYVETYEIGSVLAVHVACPRLMSMRFVERTLLTRASESSDDPADQTGMKAYDLRSFISRVGGCHYIAYTKKCD